MKRINGRELRSLTGNLFRIFNVKRRIEPVPHILVDSGHDMIVSFDLRLWKLAEIALLDAERRKAQIA